MSARCPALGPSSVAPASPLPVLVILDQQLETLGRGLDLGGVQRWLQEAVAAVCVQCATDPGRRPAELGRALAAAGAARLVLGLCSQKYAVGDVQTEARLAGLDPLGVEVLDLGTHAALVHPRLEATEKAKLLLAASVAKARAFPGSRPEMVKPHVPTSTSRRLAFALSRLEYRAVPWIEQLRCAAEDGCRLCVQACPQGALRTAGGDVRLDKAACDGCGLCVAACPRDAVLLPGQARGQLDAQLATLLDPRLTTLAPRGILFACPHNAAALAALAHAGRSYPAGWLPLQVPCVGMLTPDRLLGCLAAGAVAVAVVAPGRRCPPGQREALEGRIDFCRAFLQPLGYPEGPVLLAPTSAPELARVLSTLPDHAAGQDGVPPPSRSAGALPLTPSPSRGGLPRSETKGKHAAALFLHLAQNAAARTDLSLTHPHSPFGVVELAPGCTACGVCAQSCPTRALVLQQRQDGVTLTFDSALCTACGQCVPRCTEAEGQVLRLHRVTDLKRLGQGRTTLYRDQARLCIACGRPIAPGAMLQRITALLGDEAAATAGLISRYCTDCRGAVGSSPAALPSAWRAHVDVGRGQ